MQCLEGKDLQSFVELVGMRRGVLHDNINQVFDGGLARDVNAQGGFELSLPACLRPPQQFDHHDDAGDHSETLAIH